MDWWYEITKIEQVLYIIAATATAMLLVHTAYFLMSHINNKQTESSGIKSLLFNTRSLLTFISIGSWTTIIAYKAIRDFVFSFIIGAVAGVAAMVLLCFCLHIVLKMEGTPAIDTKETIGNSGIVYATVPGKGEGRGKVSLVINDKMCVYDAIAYEDNKIPRGNDIKVVDTLGSGLLLVESIQEEK